MNRRSFLSRSLLSAASFGVGSALPFGRRGRLGLRSAQAAPLPTPYPVLVIMLGGGLDPAMHLVATPNGRYGNVVISNRLPGTTDIKETASGIRYAAPTVTPTGKADFAPHLKDVALLRAIELYPGHADIARAWIGDFNREANASKTPWGSILAAQFRARGAIVRKPCGVAYGKRQETNDARPYLNYVAWAGRSPDPATVTDRISSIQSYFEPLSGNTGTPFPRLAPGYGLVDALDGAMPSATQPDFTGRFAAANIAANAVLQSSSKPVWPLPPSLISTFGLTASGISSEFAGDARIPEMCALAYHAFANGLTHVIGFHNVGSGIGQWDSHQKNMATQMRAGNVLWSNLGKLITLMKATKSPIDPSKSLFDTTNIWVQSEMGRTVGGRMGTDPNDSNRLDGTDHWRDGSVVFMGGRFKRGIALGGLGPDWHSIPFNPATGKEAGAAPIKMDNLIATVMKAAGGDPTGWTKAAPVDALLDMSL